MAGGTRVADLTPRQKLVVGLVAQGLTTKQIAHHEGVSERAIKARLSGLYRRHRVPNRAGLIAVVLSDGLAESLSAGHEELMASAFEPYRNARFLVGVTRGPSHEFVYYNVAALRFLGLASESALGHAFDELFAVSPALRQARDQAYEGGGVVAHTDVVRWQDDTGAGREVLVDIVINPIRGRDGRVLGLLFIGMPTEDE